MESTDATKPNASQILAEQMKDESKCKSIEAMLRKNIKSKSLTEDAFTYMALLINEDAPKNTNELVDLIGDFLSDGMAYYDAEITKVCGILHKLLMEEKLVNVENRDTIIAEKLIQPITINDLVEIGHHGIVKEDDFYDPLLAGEKPNNAGNYNRSEGKEEWIKKKEAKKNKNLALEQDALDQKINEFIKTKEKVPPPRVIHDKSENTKADLYLPKITLVAGGKALLQEATLRLTRGRKYGLVGKNGIGKTTLMNAMCRRDLDKMPMNLHVLQVEQEVIADDISVRDHVIQCDVERLNLLKEQKELENKDTSEMEPEDK